MTKKEMMEMINLLRAENARLSSDVQRLSLNIDELMKAIKKNKQDDVPLVRDMFICSGSETVANHYIQKIGTEKKEHVYVLLLNTKNRLIREELLSIGTLDSSIVHPREVFAPALKESAANILLVHNHPSGDVSPSWEDKSITERIKKAGSLIGINLVDHIIVSSSMYYSFRAESNGSGYAN